MFHIAVLCLAIVAGALIVHYGKNITKKQLHFFLTLSACLYTVLEIYKQFIIRFVLVDGALVLQLQWYSLPVFFCSLPLYLLPVAVIAKKNSVNGSGGLYAGWIGAPNCVFPPPPAVGSGGTGQNQRDPYKFSIG